MKLFSKIAVAVVATISFIVLGLVLVQIGLERENRRICIQSHGWTSESTYGAPASVVPEYCYEKGYLERP